MAARLPIVGGDNGNWGTILNQFLRVSHQSDGTLGPDVVGSAQLTSDAVTANLGVNGVANGSLLSVDATRASGVRWVLPASASSSVSSSLTGVCIEQNGAYPTRPAEFANVKFVGVNDPGSAAQDGDEWIKL
jgi:hypothetical protein